jgi:outer membrane protein OmpA-like peptidoglycan-associated protein
VHDVPRTTGQPLDAVTRAYMEPRFGRDFSRVRVHADGAAGTVAQAVGAVAFTASENVVFAPGRFNPASDDGRELLAHELAHVVQQADATATDAIVGEPGDTHEASAQLAATAVAAGEPAPPPQPGARTPAVQRSPDATDDHTLRMSPLLLASLGSMTLDAFVTDSSALTPVHQSLLGAHAKMLLTLFNSDPDATVVVTGHTDLTGTETHNAGLSMARAEAVLAALVAAGVDHAKLVASGAGESQPRVSTLAANDANRRVEVRFRPTLVPRLRPSGPALGGLSLTGPPPGSSSALGPGTGPFTGLGTGQGPLTGLAPGLGLTPKWPIPGSPMLDRFTPPGVPDLRISPRNWLENGLKSDPFLRTVLPDFLRDKALSAMEGGDVILAEKAIDGFPLDDKTKAAVKAAVRALLETFKGKRWTAPTPSPYQLPPSGAAPMPPLPPTFLNLPPVRF